MYCKNCGTEITDAGSFCGACGTPLGQGSNYCANCGSALVPGAVVCSQCGTAVNSSVYQQPAQQNYQQPAQPDQQIYQGTIPQQNYQQPGYQQPMYPQQPKVSKAYGITGFVLSLVGLLCCFPLPFGIAAIVLSCISKKKNEPCTGMATAGLIIGIIAVVLGVISIIMMAVSPGIVEMYENILNDMM